MTVVVTNHAIDRYRQRIAPVARHEAAQIMLAASRGIEAAAAIGGHVVRLSSGARLFCRGRDPVRIVTVYPQDALPGGDEPRMPPIRQIRGRARP